MNHQVPYDEDFVPEQDDFTPDTFDSYLQLELALSQGSDDQPQYGKVKKRLKENDNPLLNTRMYEVEFPSGQTEGVTSLQRTCLHKLMMKDIAMY
jgi:hypothetical protein